MKMNWPLTLTICVALGVSAISVRTSAEPRAELRDFMRVKLKHSQAAIEGLVNDDLEKVAKSAQEMSLLSLAETWQVLNTPQYIAFSRKFRKAADALADAAKKNNLDRATTEFNNVTTQCVECHKYVRDVRMARAGQ
jgi:cytochrome c556